MEFKLLQFLLLLRVSANAALVTDILGAVLGTSTPTNTLPLVSNTNTTSTNTSNAGTNGTMLSNATSNLTPIHNTLGSVVDVTSNLTSTVPSIAGTCDSSFFDYTPTVLTGVLNSTRFQVTVAPTNSNKTSKKMASQYYNGSWEIYCLPYRLDSFPANMTWMGVIYLNSSSSTNRFTVASNPTTCYLKIFADCGLPLTSLHMPARMGILVTIPSGNISRPITSSYGVQSALAASTAQLQNSSVSCSDKVAVIANLASNMQQIVTQDSSLTSNSSIIGDSIISSLQSVVASSTSADIAAAGPQIVASVKSLVEQKGSSSINGRTTATTVLTSLLGSILNTSSLSGFTNAIGNDIATIVANIITDAATSQNSIIIATVELLSKIAASQAKSLASNIVFVDQGGEVSVLASVTSRGNFTSIKNGNTTINVGSAFTALLASINTTTVTSRSTTLAVNPFNSISADPANSTRSNIFQFSILDDFGDIIPVRMLSSNFSISFALTPTMITPTFTNSTLVPTCQYWNTTVNKWSTDGCYYDHAHSNSTVGVCNCNHLTAFSVSFASISPNTLNPVSDAQNAQNAKTVYVIGTLAAMFWIGFVLYRWYQHRNQYVKQSGHTMEDFAAYSVCIKTDANANSGVSARTYITVHGDEGDSERIMFAQGLRPGSKVKKTIIALNVGNIASIELGHDETGSLLHWKPSEVTILNLSNNTTSRFIPTSIIHGKSVSFNVCGQKTSALTFFGRLRNQLTINIQDRHIWLSTYAAPASSRFTHTERVATCFLLFFGNMGLGFWFHKTRTITADFLSILVIAIITSGIMLVLTVPLTIIYRRAANSDMEFESDVGYADNVSATKSGPISIRWRYFAWVVTVVATLGGIVLSILAALQLDASGTSALRSALQSTAISIVESWLISNPLIVVARSVWNSRKDTTLVKTKRALHRTFEDSVKSTAMMVASSNGSSTQLTSNDADIMLGHVVNDFYKNSLNRSHQQSTML